jgi:hypothetical protein
MSAAGGDLEAKLRVSLTGQDELLAFYNKSTAGVKGFRNATNAELNAVGRDITSFASGAVRALGAIGGIGAGVSFVSQAKGVLELRDSVAELTATANLGEDAMDGLRKQMLSTGIATNQFGKDLSAGLQAFVAKTGDIETGRKYLELYGKTATATRSSVADIANIGADLQKLKITDQGQALAILAKQSDVGAVELKDLVSQGPRLLAAFQGAGLEGEQGLRHGGALAQVFQKGTGNVDRTSTAVEAAFRDIAERVDRIEGSGVQVRGRDRTDVIKDLIRATKGDEFALRQGRGGQGIFGDEAFRGIQVMASEFRQTGGFGTFDQFSNVQADPELLNRKYAINSNTALAKMKAAQIRMQASTDANFGDTIDSAAGGGAGLLSSAYGFTMEHPLLVGAGALAGRSALRMGMRALRGGAGGSGGIAGAVAGAVTGGSGVGIPVSVTNWPDGLGVGGAAGKGAAAAIGEAIADKAKLGLLPRAVAAMGGTGGLLAAGAGIAATLAASVSVVSKLNNAMPQIRKETEDQLRAHQEQIAANEVGKGQASGDLLLGTFGRFGGAFTASQARAARKGFGSYGRSASDVLGAFGEQQQTLDLLARSEEGGVGEDLISSDPKYKLILDALNATNPAFKGAKSGKDKAKILRSLIAGNDADSYKGPEQSLVDVSTPSTGLPYMFGLEHMLGGAGDRGTDAMAMLREALGLTFNITIAADGTATVDTPEGTRSPKVMARRTSGAS